MGYPAMAILILVAGFFGFQYMIIEFGAKTSIHQIYAAIYAIIAAVAFAGAMITGTLAGLSTKIEKTNASLEKLFELAKGKEEEIVLTEEVNTT